LADAAYQLRETRFAKSLLNGVVRSVGGLLRPQASTSGLPVAPVADDRIGDAPVLASMEVTATTQP
jgi:hypothetical protein